MELSRRDALVALAAGASGGGLVLAGHSVDPPGAAPTPDGRGADAGVDPAGDSPVGDHERETMVAVARTVYPSDLSGIRTFVTTVLDGRVGDPDHAAGIDEAVARLDELTTEWYDAPFVALDSETRDRSLRETGADTADPDPDGSPAERIRYYLVNELLYALFTSPTGGELVGIENPIGHPGGIESYRRGPTQR